MKRVVAGRRGHCAASVNIDGIVCLLNVFNVPCHNLHLERVQDSVSPGRLVRSPGISLIWPN